jgi:class 3 adenylate cyclase
VATETVTVLFTDLVGSTELLSRVGEVAAEELRREHFGLLRKAIDDAGGREVKNLGDGLMVAFDGVGGGLAAAVAMQQALAARPPDRERLEIRVGVAVGEADAAEGDYFGLPVVEAARLCATASGGEILTSGFVRMLARSRGGFDMDPVGALELKGLDEPVEAFRVRWEPLAAADVAAAPIPPRVVSLAAGTFVGRGDERSVLDVAAKEALGGDRRAVLLSGEPGIGKTTLASHFALSASGEGWTVLYGRCDEDLGVPYQPWLEALASLVEHAPDELVADHVEACGSVLGRVVPQLWRRTAALAADAGPGDDESDLVVLLSAVVDLLARAGEQAPVVLLLDDLHWADDASVQLLRHVLTANRELRLLVVGTFRDSDVGPTHPLTGALAALRREHGVERLGLRGFGDDDLLELLEAVAGHAMTDDGVALRDALLAETEGNPFFVAEMLRHLAATGGIRQDTDGRWYLELDLGASGLPVSIREVVARRVAALGPETERVLTMAAVIGRDFDLDLLERVVDFDADHLVDLCDAAVDAAVLRETEVADRYSFAHALIERSLYDELSTGRRVRAHRVVAEALEELCGDHLDERVGELAHHWAQATRPQDVAKAVDYARLAGDRALATLAPVDALRWYGDALALLDQPQHAERVGIAVRVSLGEAQKLCDDPDHRSTLLVAARDAITIGADDLLVRAALANNRGAASTVGDVDTDRVAVLRAAIGTLDEADSAERARLLAVLSAELTYADDRDEPVALAEEAIAIARRLGTARVFVEVVSRCDIARTVPDTLVDRTRDTHEALRLAEPSSDPVVQLQAHRAAAFVALDRGDRDALEAHTRRVADAAERIGYGYYRVQAAMLDACLAMLDGDPDDVDAAGGRLLELGTEAGVDDVLTMWSGAVLISAWMRGRLGDLVPVLEQYVADSGLPIFESTLVWAHSHHDRPRAGPLLTQARERGFPAPYDHLWLSTHAAWADATYRLRDAESAAILLARLELWPDHVCTTRSSVTPPAASNVAGLRVVLGDVDLAVALYERAVTIERRGRATFQVAVSETMMAGALVELGGDEHLERARALAQRNLTLARERGYGYVERDALAVLDRVGPDGGRRRGALEQDEQEDEDQD